MRRTLPLISKTALLYLPLPLPLGARATATTVSTNPWANFAY